MEKTYCAEIKILNGTTVYMPAVEDGIEWVTERKGTPGKLTFSVLDDGKLDIREGNAVQFRLNGQDVFWGYIFIKKRDKENKITVTCYDQLRYFKNKDTYVYVNKTASQILKMICSDFGLLAGTVDDTGYVISKKTEQNKTLFDIIQNALDDTLMNTRKMYCLYDDCGKISLKNIADLRCNLLIDAETGQNFDYESSIDDNVYNKVKLVYDNKETGKREVYLITDNENINKWGILQYFDTLNEGENGMEKANVLLSYYNRKTRKLSVSGAWGDIRIRAGVSPVVQMQLGDITVNNFMLCESVKHSFKNNEHTMDLTLIGGEFVV